MARERASTEAWLAVFTAALQSYDEICELTPLERSRVWQSMFVIECGVAVSQLEGESEYAHYSVESVTWFLRQRGQIQARINAWVSL